MQPPGLRMAGKLWFAEDANRNGSPMNAIAVGHETREQVHRQLQHSEVRRRVALLGQHRMLSCPEALLRLQASGLSRAQALREVRTQRALFYVQLIDVAYFPAFQWRHVQLRPSIAAVLDILHFRTKWQIALWFTEENDVLDGLRPIDAFDLSPSLVINAATAEVRSGNASH